MWKNKPSHFQIRRFFLLLLVRLCGGIAVEMSRFNNWPWKWPVRSISTNIKVVPAINWLQGGKTNCYTWRSNTPSYMWVRLCEGTSVEMWCFNHWSWKMTTQVTEYKAKNNTGDELTSTRQKEDINLQIGHSFWLVGSSLLLTCRFVTPSDL